MVCALSMQGYPLFTAMPHPSDELQFNLLRGREW